MCSTLKSKFKYNSSFQGELWLGIEDINTRCDLLASEEDGRFEFDAAIKRFGLILCCLLGISLSRISEYFSWFLIVELINYMCLEMTLEP